MESWGMLLNWGQDGGGGQGIALQIRDVRVRVLGEVAWVNMKANVLFHVTNVYELCNGRWYMVHHHSSLMADPPPHNMFAWCAAILERRLDNRTKISSLLPTTLLFVVDLLFVGIALDLRSAVLYRFVLGGKAYYKLVNGRPGGRGWLWFISPASRRSELMSKIF
jgi:hypothetical protein